ncbi:MAG: cytochrome c [Magnetococcales bacterium]|nr:cytochrome c [Magnetococcales bacterium]
MLRKIPRTVLVGALLGLLMTGGLSSAQAADHDPVGPRLTERLQGLIRQEMNLVETATLELWKGMVVGDLHKVAEQARAIHNSFILKQQLTPQDKQDLKRAVPAEFIAQDQAFHQLAAKTAEAAHGGDRALVQYYFGRMTSACITCHGQYATDRFPLLAPKKSAPAMHHDH